MSSIYISAPSCWAPGITTTEDWQHWANGAKQIASTSDAPKLEYTSPLFRRRLSQISKMTIEVVHDTLEKTKCGDITQVFTSLRGEISRQFSISKQFICDKLILPASFSLSVFNTPIALASLAFKLKSGYSVLFPSQGNFESAFKTAVAPILCERHEKIIFVYADELVQDDYGDLRPQINEPLAFAFVVSATPTESYKKISLEQMDFTSPHAFLKKLLIA